MLLVQSGDKTAEVRELVTRGIGNLVWIFNPCEKDKSNSLFLAQGGTFLEKRHMLAFLNKATRQSNRTTTKPT